MTSTISLNIYPDQFGGAHWSSASYADLQIFDILGVVSSFTTFAGALLREAVFEPAVS
jgi:hypothetical protein